MRRKQRVYPELVNSPHLRLLVLACEVGGRWGGDAPWLIRALAEHKTATTPEHLRARARKKWESRWWTLLSVSVQDAVAASLLNDGVFRAGWEYAGEPALDDLLATDNGDNGGPVVSRVR